MLPTGNALWSSTASAFIVVEFICVKTTLSSIPEMGTNQVNGNVVSHTLENLTLPPIPPCSCISIPNTTLLSLINKPVGFVNVALTIVLLPA